MIYCLEVEDVIELNRIYTGGHLLDRSGLEGTLARPMHTFQGVDLYPTFVEKAAALLHGLATTQYFSDGNKRTAWLSCVVYLAGADLLLRSVDDYADEFVCSVAQGQLNQEKAAAWITEHLLA